jgi:hypothetical protein
MDFLYFFHLRDFTFLTPKPYRMVGAQMEFPGIRWIGF